MNVAGVRTHVPDASIPSPEPNRNGAGSASDRCRECSIQKTGSENRARCACCLVEVIAQGDIGVMKRGNLHQPARDIDRIADSGDVLMAVAAEPGCDDLSEMRSDLEIDMRRNRVGQSGDPALHA